MRALRFGAVTSIPLLCLHALGTGVTEMENHMAEPRAFISFDFDNNKTEKTLFAGQATKDSPSPFTVEDWSSKSPLPQKEWEAILKAKINKCNMLIVLVGKRMASAGGVAKEIAMAKKQDVPVFGVYVDGANAASALPSGLSRSRTVGWDWNKIGAKINEMMKEAKNKSK